MTRRTPGSGADASPELGRVLAIDTATPGGSIALRVGGETRERVLEWRASFRQAAPAIDELLAEAGILPGELDAIAVPSGPGSFTGLRVGAALALGLARITGVTLSAVPTLAAVAEAFAPPTPARVCATLDARRGRFYAALYDRVRPAYWRLVAGPLDATPAEIVALAEAAPVVGPDPAAASPAGLAGAVALLASADPARYALIAPEELKLIYARPGVDSR
ncbi:MAG TPA: tRNA (adenosine(37)-N6)-threonylcarbamoyltransferase complex dimerization subunit type 1 TsaB [Gemmatimonadota bacterium]|nr:tRNA (adenosine(37)-N6)-threonylcarbamoyltransferase complex dimerization subunit type 1 TsaB [Gemmatimonadota bacterium]